MRLRKFDVARFGSIASGTLDPITDYLSLVGRNGAGKSFLLQALEAFSTEFSITGGSSNLNQDLFWFGRDVAQPIALSGEFELTETEIQQLFPNLGTALRSSRLFITRFLAPNGTWTTELITVGGVTVVEKDQASRGETVSRIDPSRGLIPGYQVVLFDSDATKSNLSGHKMLVDVDNKRTFHTNPDIDQLATQGLFHIEEQYIGEDYPKWATTQGLDLIDRPPTPEEIAHLLEEVQARTVQTIVADFDAQAFVDYFRHSFHFVPAARDNVEARPRATSLPVPVQQELNRVSESPQPREQRTWWVFKQDIETFIGKGTEPSTVGIQFWATGLNMRLPTGQLGGGEQALLLVRSALIGSTVQIVVIDEPELHFHPTLSRHFARWLMSKSTDKQIIVATHSPHFVDKKKVTNNWLITNDAGQTRMSQVKDRDEFRLVLAELGLLPSDVFLNDLTIFVEGKSDRAFLEFAFASLGMPVDENAIGLMPIGGSDKERIKDTVDFWVGLMESSGAKFLVHLDANRSTMLSQLVAVKGWDAMQFRTWQKGQSKICIHCIWYSRV